MTYCVGLMLDRGIVMMSDTRTNAGVDNISVFKKMTTWEVPGERVISIMSSGNLATTQSLAAGSALDVSGRNDDRPIPAQDHSGQQPKRQ